MQRVISLIKVLSGIMYWIAGAALVSIVLLTVTDVILRRFRVPIDFAFEIVVLLAAIVVSFSLPRSTLEKGHIVTEFLIEKLPKVWKRIFFTATRMVAVSIFAVFGWRVMVLAAKFSKAGQVSPILEFPEHIVTYLVAAACFVECLALLADLWEGSEGGHA